MERDIHTCTPISCAVSVSGCHSPLAGDKPQGHMTPPPPPSPQKPSGTPIRPPVCAAQKPPPLHSLYNTPLKQNPKQHYMTGEK